MKRHISLIISIILENLLVLEIINEMGKISKDR